MFLEKKAIKNLQTPISSLSLHPRSERNDDSVAQPVEHNTFNVGVLGSNPSWITKRKAKRQQKTDNSFNIKVL